jgi:hypothetical protein
MFVEINPTPNQIGLEKQKDVCRVGTFQTSASYCNKSAVIKSTGLNSKIR